MFARHHPSVLAYAARRVGRTEAGDVAAETFTVAWRRLSRVPHEPATLPWLYGVARNVVRNHLRSRRRAERLVMRQAGEAGAAATADPEILEALDRLSSDDREILMLAAWEGLASSEIAAVLGCSPNTAAVRLHRARRRLEAVMEGDSP